MPDINHDTWSHAGVPGVPAGGAVELWALIPDTGMMGLRMEPQGAANRAIIEPASLLAAATITGIRIRIGTSSGNICVGLYDSTLALVATSGSVASPGNGLRSISFTAPYVATAGRYYIGFSADNNTAQISRVNGGTGLEHVITAHFMATAHPLPDPFVSAGTVGLPFEAIGLIDGGWAP